ncbi:hypothetical protein T8J41_09105 [Nitratireductor rhodophyticola]|uniref:GlsB/YeaQ/YmgE family stress response membrane protein n=1 Tax=Nitratireductor rhodophyticola TaxID=2854036 RepID=A0ABS7R6A2_9HYPH|nr:hypothetical protein [Nitratireductor rhodophyticola]MBY8915910.1 hypothetical protein [Nitratireductor rhodophyticola]MBY8921273.1 hypothetical protein [Nitratireductor rhodophyticola]MEC9246944.1 hypothetical protein [Pseudomonadota bacterium]WPZ15936.1 hypothetical protein T8J41_09105 [Nitratireductor rhodophyticola]
MLMKLDTSWLIFALVAVTMIAYILSLGLDAAMKDDGFGAVGNAVIITAAFFGTIHLANQRGIRFSSLTEGATAGLGGAFAALLVLVVVKAVLRRLS